MLAAHASQGAPDPQAAAALAWAGVDTRSCEAAHWRAPREPGSARATTRGYHQGATTRELPPGAPACAPRTHPLPRTRSCHRPPAARSPSLKWAADRFWRWCADHPPLRQLQVSASPAQSLGIPCVDPGHARAARCVLRAPACTSGVGTTATLRKRSRARSDCRAGLLPPRLPPLVSLHQTPTTMHTLALQQRWEEVTVGRGWRLLTQVPPRLAE